MIKEVKGLEYKLSEFLPPFFLDIPHIKSYIENSIFL